MIKDKPSVIQPARGRIPKWIFEALERAEQAAEPGELPMARISARYPGTSKELFVIMRMRDFVEHFTVAERPSEDPPASEEGR